MGLRVYGPSGCEYMENQYGRTLNWAMAGRSAEKLADVREEIGACRDTAGGG